MFGKKKKPPYLEFPTRDGGSLMLDISELPPEMFEGFTVLSFHFYESQIFIDVSEEDQPGQISTIVLPESRFMIGIYGSKEQGYIQ